MPARVLLAILVLLLLPAGASAAPMASNADGDVVVDESFAQYTRGSGKATARFDRALAPELAFWRNGWRPRPSPSITYGSHADIADDGSIVVADYRSVERLLLSGEPDPAFVPFDPSTEIVIKDLAVRDDGGVLLNGWRKNTGGEFEFLILALTPGGARDQAFGSGGIVGLPPSVGGDTLEILPDGRIFVAGGRGAARLEPDGDPDLSFGAGGVVELGGSWSTAAPSGGGVVAVREAEGGGLEIQRRLESGEPDPDWGTGGSTIVRLDARDPDPEVPDDEGITYYARSVMARPGGGAVVGAQRILHDWPNEEDQNSGVPVLFDAGGELERVGDPVDAIFHVEPLPAGGFATYAGYVRPHGGGDRLTLAAYDATGTKLVERRLAPYLIAPDLTITSGPPTEPGAVTGSSAQFAVDVTPAPEDGGDVVLRCTLGAAPEAPCPADLRFEDLRDGPATLGIRALGINGASSAVREYRWTVNRGRPTTTVTGAPPATTDSTAARIEFAADEPATFACTVDGAAPVACDGGVLELSGLALGAHEVTVQATDRSGVLEAAPVVVRWTVVPAPPATVQQPGSPTPRPPVVSAPKRIDILKVGKVRRGRVRVRVLTPDSGPVHIAVNARIGGRTRRLGARVVRGRAGVARTWVVKLTRRGQRTLDRAARRGQRVRIRATATPVGDAAAR